jgi:hypothetical protein
MKFNSLKYMKVLTVTIVVLQLLYLQNLSAQDESNSTKAKIAISFAEEDSVRQVKAVITKTDSSGKENPIKGIEIKFCVKKSFGLLPLEGDNTTTDANGEASVEFPKDLPGDSLGNVTVIAKVEDNDAVGNIETAKTVKWGKPVLYVKLNQRALWASGKNAPVPLVIIVSGMVLGAWTVIMYILYQLIQIKKSGNYEIKNQS